jgi:hypothetical protein
MHGGTIYDYNCINFLLDISQIYKIEPIPVSMNDCWKMHEKCWKIRSNKCMGKAMTCDGSQCSYRAAIQPSYKWLNILIFEGFNCHVTQRVIGANKLNDTLFNSQYPACKAAGLVCAQHDHTIVWQADVMHTFPYEIIATSQLPN